MMRFKWKRTETIRRRKRKSLEVFAFSKKFLYLKISEKMSNLLVSYIFPKSSP